MDTFADFYQNSEYASFEQDVRRGGTFGLTFLDVKQGAIETADPAIPEVPFVTTMNKHDAFQYDFGDGWKTHSYAQGVVDIQPPNQECRFRLPDLHLRIAFAPEQQLRALLDERGMSLTALEGFSGQFRSSAMAFALIQDMWRLSLYDDPATNLMIDGLWLSLVSKLLADTDKRLGLAPASAIGDARLGRVVEYIEEHLSEPLCVGNLAAVACMSTTQFSRSFKSALGQTPAKYVTQRRCRKAEELLRKTKLPVTAVAAICGFRNVSYFWTVFKRETGRTPAEIRQH